jgi:RNA polymerase sigma-70 factor, ECF subfamily
VSGSGAVTYNILCELPPDIRPIPSLQEQRLKIDNNAFRANGPEHRTKVERFSWPIPHGGVAIGVRVARGIADAWQCPVYTGIYLIPVNASSYGGAHSGQSATPTGMKPRLFSGKRDRMRYNDSYEAMIAAIPRLNRFAISLCRDIDFAKDLVQEALLRALVSLDSFEPGTNMSAWLFTILRNEFYSRYRKHRFEVEDIDGLYAGQLASLPEQMGRLDINELRRVLKWLSVKQRDTIVLVGVLGFSYSEAALICECSIGTIKSRLSRARRVLGEILFLESTSDIFGDREAHAVLDLNDRGVAPDLAARQRGHLS